MSRPPPPLPTQWLGLFWLVLLFIKTPQYKYILRSETMSNHWNYAAHEDTISGSDIISKVWSLSIIFSMIRIFLPPLCDTHTHSLMEQQEVRTRAARAEIMRNVPLIKGFVPFALLTHFKLVSHKKHKRLPRTPSCFSHKVIYFFYLFYFNLFYFLLTECVLLILSHYFSSNMAFRDFVRNETSL